jgi:hypothetical protein
VTEKEATYRSENGRGLHNPDVIMYLMTTIGCIQGRGALLAIYGVSVDKSDRARKKHLIRLHTYGAGGSWSMFCEPRLLI